MIFQPSREFIESTNVWSMWTRLGFTNSDDFLRFGRERPEAFWAEMMREMNVEWYEPFTRVLDDSAGPQWSQWFCGGRLNIAQNCLYRWANDSGRVACIWEGENGDSRTITFREIAADASRIANGLKRMDLEPGDRVALCMPMLPEILPIIYGCLASGLIVVPIFAGFGAGAIATRLEDSGAKVVFTADHLIRRGQRVPLASKVPESVTKIVIGGEPLFSGESDTSTPLPLDSEARAFILYTSGTTGRPKGTVHTHAGCLAQTGKEVWLGFDHKPSDIFFWLTDIGWMMGPWMILGNHLFGGTIFIYDGAPDYPSPMRLWDMIGRHRITTFGLSPTAIRLLMKRVTGLPSMPSLRLLGSSGEPWDEPSWLWFFEQVGGRRCPVINISGGTEIIGCFLFPLPTQGLKPCTLGGPAPGMAVDVVDENGGPVRGRKGYLVCTHPSPSMTRGIWNDPARYIETYWSRFPGMWYHGDWASIDEDGHWFLHGRADESMNVAGRKVGPAEVEEAIMRLEGIAEAAVIGVPDEIKGEAIVAYTVVRPGVAIDANAISSHLVDFLGAVFRPREVIILPELPKTQSGKIVRRLLRQKYLGEPLDDLSTVANPGVIL